MSALRFLYAFLTIFVFATLVFVSPIFANNNQEIASLAIANAEETILSAYEAVLEAEQAGGHVTDLLTQLNDAEKLLAMAQVSYKKDQQENGDFKDATQFANSSKNIGEEVKDEAYELRDLAWNDSFQRIWSTMLASISGIILAVLASLWSWRFLKRRY